MSEDLCMTCIYNPFRCPWDDVVDEDGNCVRMRGVVDGCKDYINEKPKDNTAIFALIDRCSELSFA